MPYHQRLQLATSQDPDHTLSVLPVCRYCCVKRDHFFHWHLRETKIGPLQPNIRPYLWKQRCLSTILCLSLHHTLYQACYQNPDQSYSRLFDVRHERIRGSECFRSSRDHSDSLVDFPRHNSLSVLLNREHGYPNKSQGGDNYVRESSSSFRYKPLRKNARHFPLVLGGHPGDAQSSV